MIKKIPQSEKVYLRKVAELMFSNPFAHDVSEVESLTGLSLENASDEHFYVLLKPRLDTIIDTLANAGINTIHNLEGEDRHIYTASVLFVVYDRYIDNIDDLITQQIQQPEKTIKVVFYQAVMSDLSQFGFDEEYSVRYFSLFYQLRRAYLFICRELTGDAECMKRLRRNLWNNIFTSDALLYVDNLWNRMEDFSTLLLGETGTGKGAAARAIGCSGLIPFDLKTATFKTKFTESFISINLLEYPENLLESELFGHTKGAFTGAVSNYDGLFKRCNLHGALFLDEIGDVNTSIQIKLLKVLQERQFSPVGRHESFRFSGRVIAATNRNLTELREQGIFRDDFYYRLSSDVIEIPSLYARLEQNPNELSLLVDSLMTRLVGQSSPEMSKRIVAQLQKSVPKGYSWPGNVRELEQAIRRTILGKSYTGERQMVGVLPEWLSKAASGELSASVLLAEYCSMLYSREGSFERVAVITGLDRRTVKKYIDA